MKIYDTEKFGFPFTKFRVSICWQHDMNQTPAEFRFTAPVERVEVEYECEVMIANRPFFDNIQKGDEFFMGRVSEPYGGVIVLERLEGKANSMWRNG